MRLALVTALLTSSAVVPARALPQPIPVPTPVAGPNVNMIAGPEPTEPPGSCTAGKQVAQNEMTIAVNPGDPQNLVAGANDYRLLNTATGRRDASGGVYRSTDGGATWSVGMLPGLVSGDAEAPGPYQVAGDPAISAGPDDTFWYATIAFDRTTAGSSVAVNRSTDGGATWTTSFVVRSNDGTLHDKEWIGADPADPLTAYVVWSKFQHGVLADIMLSKTTDGGTTWSSPRVIGLAPAAQAAVAQVDDRGWVHVVYAMPHAAAVNVFLHAMSVDGGATFATRPIGLGTLGTATTEFRMPNHIAGFSADGPRLHVVWSALVGSSTEIIYTHSPNNGLTWIGPVPITAAPGDQFFPWVDGSGDKVFASWNTLHKDQIVSYDGAASADGGTTWSSPVAIAPPFDVARTNRFRANCELFIGDYTAISVGADGVAHAMWSDGRIGNDPATGADLDPYTATLSLP